MKQPIVCEKCKAELADKSVVFQYLSYHFEHRLPVCPVCGQVYISEELANDKIKEVEKMLEEK